MGRWPNHSEEAQLSKRKEEDGATYILPKLILFST